VVRSATLLALEVRREHLELLPRTSFKLKRLVYGTGADLRRALAKEEEERRADAARRAAAARGKQRKQRQRRVMSRGSSRPGSRRVRAASRRSRGGGPSTPGDSLPGTPLLDGRSGPSTPRSMELPGPGDGPEAPGPGSRLDAFALPPIAAAGGAPAGHEDRGDALRARYEASVGQFGALPDMAAARAKSGRQGTAGARGSSSRARRL
jgi:hypothetical protein